MEERLIKTFSVKPTKVIIYNQFEDLMFVNKIKNESDFIMRALEEYTKNHANIKGGQITDFVSPDAMALPPISLYTDIKEFRTVCSKADTDKLIALKDKWKRLFNVLDLELEDRIDG